MPLVDAEAPGGSASQEAYNPRPMPTRPEQGGALSEASRLLQEGLQLLDERRREVDLQVQQAQERAQQITTKAEERAQEIAAQAEQRAQEMTAQAEQRAQEITAEAERHRVELEEQVAALRAEVAGLREELAQLRAGPKGSRGGRAAVVAAVTGLAAGGALARPATAAEASTDEPAAAEAAAPEAASSSTTTSPSTSTAPVEAPEGAPFEAADLVEASEAAGTPRWGRRSTIAAAQQAVRSQRSSRPRWLPPWLPFLIVLLGAAAVVAASVDGQDGGRSPGADATTTSGNRLTSAPPASSASTLSLVAATTSLATATAVESVLAFVSPTATPTRDPLLAVAGARSTSVAGAASSTPTTSVPTLGPRPSPTLLATRQTLALPPPGARIASPVALPAEPGPEGPIVAAYTTYATYTVQPGDTLNRVASQFGVSGVTIMRTSGLADPNLLVPGQVLTIPRDTGWLYRVQPGDTLDLVALRFGLSVDDLLAASALSSPLVRPGDLLFVPNRGAPGTKQ